MASATTHCADPRLRLRELEEVVGALRRGTVDTLVCEDSDRLLVLREYELERQRERQLAELGAIVEAVPTAVAVVWRNGQIRLANRAFFDVCGPTRPATLWEWASCLQVDIPSSRGLQACFTRSFEDSEPSKPQEVILRPRDGGQLHWVMSFQRLPIQLGGRPAAMVAGNDITYQKHLIDELSDAKLHMEHFLNAAAHDLSAPLITICHNVTFARLELGTAVSDGLAECLGRIEATSKDMLDMLGQVGRVSRFGQDTEPRELHPFRELVDAALRQHQGTLDQRQAVVVVSDRLPELFCQGNKIVQVFANLISNAIKYTPADRTPRVEVGCKEDPGGGHIFFVRDNGIGIPQEHVDEAFELFRRLSSDPAVSGQGVGLTIVKRIIDLHRGRVWVESEPGKGSTFYFTVPQREVDSG